MAAGRNERACGSGNTPAIDLYRARVARLPDDADAKVFDAAVVWFEVAECEASGSVRAVMALANGPQSDPDYANRTDLAVVGTAGDVIPAACGSGANGNITFTLPSDTLLGPYTLQIEYTYTPPTSTNGTAPPPTVIIQCADVTVDKFKSAASALAPSVSATLLLALTLAITLSI